MADPFSALVHELSRLPGVGRRSAERAALSLARKGDGGITPLVEALLAVRDGVVVCPRCGALTVKTETPCRICTDVSRDASQLLVVEGAGDILALEQSGAYRGRYHSIGGRLSPAAGTGEKELAFKELAERVVNERIGEVILALGTDVEGDATAAYILELLEPTGVKVTRLAFGLPADSGVRYSDPLTLRRAFAGRFDAGLL